jgi:nicotinate-nucleotide adenylyltransferase
LYVYPRPAATVDSVLKKHTSIKMVEAPVIEISATYIRNLIKQEKSIRYLVSEKVEELILARKYYI